MIAVPEHAIQRVAEAYRATGRGRLLLEQLAGVERARQIVREPRPLVIPCKWEGEPTSDWNADPLLQVRHCEFAGHKYDRCRRGGGRCERDLIESCSGCGHRVTPAVGEVRHLLYHVYPISGNSAWQWNVDELVKRIDLFNGRIIVSVVRDTEARPRDPNAPHRHYAPCDSFDAVRDRFGPHAGRIEFLEYANNPALREGVTLVPMLERLRDIGPWDAVLYAHAKGASWPARHVSRRWAALLQEACLDYWPLVSHTLARYPLAGPMLTRATDSWYYDGSWYWFRAGELFRREWRAIDQIWTAVEVYPRRHFTVSEAGVLFFSSDDGPIRPYSRQFWDRTVEPKLRQWRQENAHLRTGHA